MTLAFVPNVDAEFELADPGYRRSERMHGHVQRLARALRPRPAAGGHAQGEPPRMSGRPKAARRLPGHELPGRRGTGEELLGQPGTTPDRCRSRVPLHLHIEELKRPHGSAEACLVVRPKAARILAQVVQRQRGRREP